MVNYVKGNLITMACNLEFEVIVHGCNCHCTMGAGIAPEMAKVFGCNKFELEHEDFRGTIDKLGCVDFMQVTITDNVVEWTNGPCDLYVVNAYTQFGLGRNHHNGSSAPADYEAITLCMRKLNHTFNGFKIGLPQIGAGLAGGDWKRIEQIIIDELVDCEVTIVEYDLSPTPDFRFKESE